MEISLLLLREIVKLFLMMFMGYALVKFKILKSEDSTVLSAVMVYLTVPCMIIDSFQIEATSQVKTGLLYAFIVAILIHILFLIFTEIFHRFFHLDVIEQVSLIYPNAGILVIPVVEALFGENYVVYSCAFMVIQIVLLWTHGCSRISPSGKMNWREILTNVNVISIVIGFLLFILHIPLPDTISQTMDTVGSMLGPVGMMLAGMVLAASPIRKLFASPRNYLTTVLRLIVYPLLLLVCFWITGVAKIVPEGKTILTIVYIAAITPVCATLTSLAQLYKGDAKHASALYVLTTLCSIVTMPVMIGLFETII